MLERIRLKTSLISAAATLLLAVTLIAGSAVADPEKAKEFFNAGIEASQAGDTEGAISAYESAIKEDDNYVDAYLNLGAIYFGQRNYESALENFKAATERGPENADAFANLGKVQYKLRQYVEAEAALKQAIALSPDNAGNYKDLALVYNANRNYPALIETVNTGHAKGGGDYLTYYMLGKALKKEGQTNDAVAALKQSVAKKSDYYNAHFALGQIYQSQEKFNLAAKSFQAALKANPKKYKASYNYAVAVESSNPDDIDGAINVWSSFVSLAKKYPKAKNDLAVAQQHLDDLKERKRVEALN